MNISFLSSNDSSPGTYIFQGGQMVTDHCRYRNHATHHIHFHSQQNESSCIFSPCPPRSLQYRRGYCPFLAFFHGTRLRLLNFVNKTFWWSRFSFWTSRHLEFWSHRASAMMPPSCKSHQYQMSYFVGNDFDMHMTSNFK